MYVCVCVYIYIYIYIYIYYMLLLCTTFVTIFYKVAGCKCNLDTGNTESVHAGDKFVELLLCQVLFYLIYYLLEFVSFNGNLRLLMFIMIIVFNLW